MSSKTVADKLLIRSGTVAVDEMRSALRFRALKVGEAFKGGGG